MSDKIKTISEDEFYEKYKPIVNHFDANAGWDGMLFETFGPELKHCHELAKKEKRVWTLIDCDEVNEEDVTNDFEYDSEDEVSDDPKLPILYIVSGFHIVNRLGFFVTEIPYDEEVEVKIEF